MDGLADWLLLGGVVADRARGRRRGRAEPDAARPPAPGARLGSRGRPRRPGRGSPARWRSGSRGSIAFLEPTLALQIVAVIAGAIAIYYAVVELIAAIAPRRRPAEGRSRAAKAKAACRPRSSWRVPALAAATIVAAAIAVGVPDHGREQARGAAGRPGPVKNCNGYAELCDRTLDEVAFPATHNAMSAAELPGWFTPNQRRGIQRQLEDGVRAFLIDTHYGIKRSSGPVLTDLDREDASKVLETVRASSSAPRRAQQFQRLSGQLRQRGGEGEPGQSTSATSSASSARPS